MIVCAVPKLKRLGGSPGRHAKEPNLIFAKICRSKEGK